MKMTDEDLSRVNNIMDTLKGLRVRFRRLSAVASTSELSKISMDNLGLMVEAIENFTFLTNSDKIEDIRSNKDENNKS